ADGAGTWHDSARGRGPAVLADAGRREAPERHPPRVGLLSGVAGPARRPPAVPGLGGLHARPRMAPPALGGARPRAPRRGQGPLSRSRALRPEPALGPVLLPCVPLPGHPRWPR